MTAAKATQIRVERLPTEHAREASTDAWAAAVDEDATSPISRCREIRRVVFTEGQGVPEDVEFDGLDPEAEHFLAWPTDAGDPRPIGTARLRFIDREAKAERVAVLAGARREGAGRALMEAIESRARELGLSAVVLHAQVAVIPFYEKLGYVAEGEVFLEADIEHRPMSKRLD